MARFTKTILVAGKHESPEGSVVATPERIRRWASQHAAMRALGIKTPVPWGHHVKAVPQYDGEAQYLASRLNAGYFPELRATDDGKALQAVIEAPGVECENGNLVTWAELPDGRKVKCAIGEVSAAVTKKFRDGRGRVWDDVITHVALTPLPVWSGQDGFQPLATAGGDETVFLSLGATGWRTLATGTGAGSMAEKNATTTDDEFDDDVVVDEGDDEGKDDVVEPGVDTEADNDIAELVELLSRICNVHVPEGQDPKTFIDHLRVVLKHMEGASGNAEMPVEGEHNAPVVAEQSPAMMSLIRENPEATAQAQAIINKANRLAEQNRKFLAEKQVREQRRLTKKLEKARKVIPAHVLDTIGIQPETLCLSLVRDTGEVVEQKKHTDSQVLDYLLAAMEGSGVEQLTQTLSTAAATPNPLVDAKKRGQVSDEESWEMAERLARRRRAEPGNNGHSGNGNGKKRRRAAV